jgi:hypothetical protein
MRILTADGYREFRWRDPKQLPDEVTQGAAMAEGSAASPLPSGGESSPAVSHPMALAKPTKETPITVRSPAPPDPRKKEAGGRVVEEEGTN